MAYVRPDVYPNGAPIPASLPPSYQPASYGEAPAGQSCFTCAHFDLKTRYCDKWLAPVKPRWWCQGWETRPMASNQGETKEIKLYKRISTTSVEEHFEHTPVPQLPKPRDNYDYDYAIENEEDTIKVNVPLMIRLLEYAREDASKDVELHVMVEKMLELSEYGDTLEMGDYPEIVSDMEDKGESKPQGPRFRF